MSVAKELEAQKSALEALIARTPEGPERTTLRDQLDDVLDKIANHAEDRVDQASAAYAEALAELQAANAAIREAQDDLAKTAQAIEKVAQAMALVQQLAAAAF